jgi:transcriptional regulator with XRE-family HTH domain
MLSFKSQYVFAVVVKNLSTWHLLIMLTPSQCRAARGLIGWNQQELADQAHIGIVTVHQFESGLSQPRRVTLEVIRRAFESAGVEFIDENGGGAGVRFRERQEQK